MKRLSARTYAQLYTTSATTASAAERKLIAKNFLGLLRRHRAMKLMPPIFVHLQDLDDLAHKRKRITVTSVSPDVTTVTKQLTDILGPIVIDLKIDPSLIGGLVLRVGDDEVDGSLRTRLITLHHHLIHDEHA